MNKSNLLICEKNKPVNDNFMDSHFRPTEPEIFSEDIFAK